MRATISWLAATLLAASPAAAQSQAAAIVNAEGNLRQDEARRFAAMMQGDTTQLGRYLAEELVNTHSNGMVETRTAQLEAIGSRMTIYESIAPAQMSFRWYDQTIAVGTGTVKSKGSLNGTPFDVTLRVTTVHVQRDLQWQLVVWQSTRIQ